MRIRLLVFVFSFICLTSLSTAGLVLAQSPIPRGTVAPEEATDEAIPESELMSTPIPFPTPDPVPRVDITQQTEEALGPLEQLLEDQVLGPALPSNPLKYAIRNAVNAGVPANTIVLLLLMPVVAAIIAAGRHVVGLRGFGIFLPAALAIVFLAVGPVIGLMLFVVIISVSTFVRVAIRRMKLRLQYLPRMAFILWFVVLGVLVTLFAAPLLQVPGFTSVSIFPVLILVLLSEDFTRAQLGKNARTAINLTTETLILALVSYIFLTMETLRQFALLRPELLLLSVLVFDYVVGKFVGLRFREYWRFRKMLAK